MGAHAPARRPGPASEAHGAKRAANVSPFKQAVAYEVFGARNPDLSTYGLSEEEAADVKREYIAFHRAYQEYRRRMLRGETDVGCVTTGNVGDGPALRSALVTVAGRGVS